jgi:hypothetical protein
MQQAPSFCDDALPLRDCIPGCTGNESEIDCEEDGDSMNEEAMMHAAHLPRSFRPGLIDDG